MKLSFFFTFISFSFFISCSDKETDNRTYLQPGIMCGTVQFTDGCSPKTDSLIRFGITLIHHMTYEDAAHTFDIIMKKDPDCFWGPWGKAMTYIHPLWPEIPTPEDMEKGYVLSDKAMKLAKKDKEKLYGATVVAYFTKGPKTKAERLVDMEKAWATAHTQLPDDIEAALFHGLFQLSTVSPTNKSYVIQREVGAMAEQILEKYPDHPGAFHYAIHAYDVPPLASKALELARNYGKIAPEVPHALHMPTHIFTRLGLWQESIDWNKKSLAAVMKFPTEGMVSPQAFHAMDYLLYAYLQLGEDEKARQVMKDLDTLKGPFYPSAITAYALASIPSRAPLEQHHWAEAANIAKPDTLEFPWKNFPQYEALIYFTRGIGAIRGGKMDIAVEALQRLETLEQMIGNAPENQYWHDQIEVQKYATKAWFLYNKGDVENGLKMIKYAANSEDEMLKNPVTPGELLPARELEGDMLMELNQPADALEAYEKSLAIRPNRFNSLYGAGRAAEITGDLVKARDYFSKLIALKGETPTLREEYVYATNMLNKK
jgi:tetratricopeptide (TPR) repeat protein